MFDVCGVVFGKRGVTERNDDLFLKIFEDQSCIDLPKTNEGSDKMPLF